MFKLSARLFKILVPYVLFPHWTYLWGISIWGPSILASGPIYHKLFNIFVNWQFRYKILEGYKMPLVPGHQARTDQNLWGGSFSFLHEIYLKCYNKKPIFQIFNKFNMAAVMAIIFNNLQLKYRKACGGRNPWVRSFSFSARNLPIMVQKKIISEFQNPTWLLLWW